MWVVHLLAHNSFAVLSGAGHRNNFCNGALVGPHKMKAAFKVQFTFPLGLLNEILTGVEESPTHSRGRSSRKFYYYGLLLPVQRTKSFTFPIKLQKGRQHEMVGIIIREVATLLMGGSKAWGWCSGLPKGRGYSCLALCSLS